MTLLTICQDAAGDCGVGRPTLVYTGTDTTSRRFLSCANREGKSLAKLNWPILRKEKTFTSVAQEIQTSAVATDWARFVDKTFWNRTTQKRLVGPYSPEQWQVLKARQAGDTGSFTFRGGDILITPTPTAGHTMAYEFYKKNWCQATGGGTERAAWGADDDVGILDEELLTLGVTWRFRMASGMEWTAAYNVYDSAVRTALGQAAPAGNLDFADANPPVMPGLYVPENIPGV